MLFELAKVLPKYQITLPKEVRDFLKVELGEQILFVETAEGLLVKRVDSNVIQTIIKQESEETS